MRLISVPEVPTRTGVTDEEEQGVAQAAELTVAGY